MKIVKEIMPELRSTVFQRHQMKGNDRVANNNITKVTYETSYARTITKCNSDR